MVLAQSVPSAHAGERSFTAEINFLASTCDNPSVHNGDYSLNLFPMEMTPVTMWDAETFATPPRLEVEGFCRVSHKVDLNGLGDDSAATIAYQATLTSLLKELTGADEVVIMPNAAFRHQSDTRIVKDTERGVPAYFVHSDTTQLGGYQLEQHFFTPFGKPYPRRIVQYNLWRLLSPAPANLPLALCDARSVRPEDIVSGPAYFPTKNVSIDTAYFHPNNHFRWAYFSKLTSDEILIFKQFDTDPDQPARVPHTAFHDPTCPSGAHPRISVECRCSARWYD